MREVIITSCGDCPFNTEGPGWNYCRFKDPHQFAPSGYFRDTGEKMPRTRRELYFSACPTWCPLRSKQALVRINKKTINYYPAAEFKEE